MRKFPARSALATPSPGCFDNNALFAQIAYKAAGAQRIVSCNVACNIQQIIACQCGKFQCCSCAHQAAACSAIT